MATGTVDVVDKGRSPMANVDAATDGSRPRLASSTSYGSNYSPRPPETAVSYVFVSQGTDGMPQAAV